MKRKKRSDKKLIAIVCAAALYLFAERTDIFDMTAMAAEPLDAAETTTTYSTDTTVSAKPADSVTISLAGDCSLGKLSIHGYAGTFYEMYDLYGASYFFRNVKDIFEKDDMTLVNFEGVLTNASTPTPKQFNIKGKPEFNQILVEGNIDAVSFGNNHNMTTV